MTTYVDLEPRHGPVGLAVGLAVLLPGRAFTPARPLLDFATQACTAAGWRVRQVWWEPPVGHPAADPAGDPVARSAWVAGEVAAAVSGAVGGTRRTLVVCKSLGTFAAPYATAHGLDAIWLTPVLTVPLVAEAIAASDARQLLIGGSLDPYRRSDLALPPGTESLTVPGADHGMVHADGVRATIRAHLSVVTRVEEWLSTIA